MSSERMHSAQITSPSSRQVGAEDGPDADCWPHGDRTIAFGTMHGKHRQIAPAFASLLGATVIAPAGIDTDQFGTFTGDIARALTPIEAARAKARLAMRVAASPFGLASEASYGPLPGIGLPGHEELVLFLDDTRDIEIVEGERQLTGLPAPLRVSAVSDAALFLAQVGFGAQGVIVRPAVGTDPAGIVKGITDPHRLQVAIEAAAGASTDGYALIGVDLRAQHNPTRREVLTQLGQRLAHRLATPCPACRCPGYGRTSTRTGLPCSACGWGTHLTTADIHSCARCHHQHVVPRPDTTADPRWCDQCNP